MNVSELCIRKATASDAAAFAAIYAPYVQGSCVSFETEAPSADEMAVRVADKSAHGFPWLTLEIAGRVAGYAYYGPWRSREAYRNTVESTIYIDPVFQGRGLGKRLYAALIDLARAEKKRAMIGVVALPNEGSEALHRSLGFERAGLFREVGYKAGRWVDVAFWELLI